MKLTAVTHTASNSCHKVSAWLSYTQGFHAWLACTPSETALHSQLGTSTLSYFNSSPVCWCWRRQPPLLCKSGEQRFCCATLLFTLACKYYMYLFIQRNFHPPLTQMSNIQVKSKLIDWILTLWPYWSIRFYFQTLLSTLNIHFFTNTKFFRCNTLFPTLW